ncbi:MAG: hypothetical protein LBN27_06460 [Prevotellaceae bacterium]|jgi:hypothetical protein|nr:hypothetical protein [Prevotellaceae bacterium]
MIITEKLKLQSENPNTAHLFKEGAFWAAYETGAYAVWLKKKYKPTRKFVKAAGQEVVSLGFPDGALKDFEVLEKYSDMHVALTMETVIDEATFLEWKNGLPMAGDDEGKSKGEKYFVPTENHIIEELRRFDLSNATPMMCMIFLSELKKKFNNSI